MSQATRYSWYAAAILGGLAAAGAAAGVTITIDLSFYAAAAAEGEVAVATQALRQTAIYAAAQTRQASAMARIAGEGRKLAEDLIRRGKVEAGERIAAQAAADAAAAARKMAEVWLKYAKESLN